MKKMIVSLTLLVCLLGSSLCLAESMTIPYPAGIDKKGAASVPEEINHPDSLYFKHPDYYNLKSNATLTMISHFKTYQQTTEETCGPVVAMLLLEYYGDQNKKCTELELAKAVKTKPYPIGTSLSGIADYFRSLGWKTDTGLQHKPFGTYEAFQDFALKNLKKGTPILVENVYWGGHWRVLIGYDTMGTKSSLDDVLIFANPYDTCDHFQDGYNAENGELFYSMWFDHSMLPKAEREQPWIVAVPK